MNYNFEERKQDYEFEDRERKLEYERQEVKNVKTATIIFLSCAVPFAAATAFGIHQVVRSDEKFNWDKVKESYVIVTEKKNIINYHLASLSKDKKYYDILNECSINKNSIVSVEEATPYFVYNDCVQNEYSKEELKKYLKDFKNNDIYTTSNDKVKIKK